MSEGFGKLLGKFVGLEEPPTLTVRALQSAELTATRLRWNESMSGHPTRFERIDGYMVCFQRRSLPPSPYWIDGRPITLQPIDGGQFLLLDLTEEHASVVHEAVDCVSMYASREALDRFYEENDFRPVGSLRTPRATALEDPVIRNLAECLLPALEQSVVASQLFIDHVGLALLSHLTTFYGEQNAVLRSIRGGLAPWQERRTKEMLLAAIDGRVGLEDLARACGLSRSHFARAFKATTGTSPLRWLLIQRVERAKNLLLNSSLSIEQIADQCGFADQSHFTRAFLKVENVPPGVWRRLRRF